MDDLFLKFLPPFLVAFAVSLSLAYLYNKAKEQPTDGKLGYGPEVKAIGWVAMTITGGTVIVMLFVEHRGQYLPLIGIAGLFGILGLYILLESYSTKGRFDDEQISMSSIWSPPKRGLWKELESASFKKNGQYFELLFSDGTRIGFSKMLRGHSAVCDHVESLGVRVGSI
ncbi:MAG: hypothetical protein HKN36_10765 [Hellea sp.]|nr:hypothetical protein [Hellea sp.]